MKVEILFRPSYSIAKVLLDPNEGIIAESGAMVGMSNDVQVETKMRGGLLQSLARSVLGGESFLSTPIGLLPAAVNFCLPRLYRGMCSRRN